LHEHYFRISRRIENVEAKAHDTLLMCEEVKRNIPPSSEHLFSELKAMNVSLQNFKHMTHKRIEEVREETRINFEKNSTAELEVKIIERMNDVVKALTRQMADRHDTKKNFRVLDK
jgi:hypothetical protein